MYIYNIIYIYIYVHVWSYDDVQTQVLHGKMGMGTEEMKINRFRMI